MEWFATYIGQPLMLAVVACAAAMFLYGAYLGMKLGH